MIAGVDARHLLGGRGVARYTRALLGALAAEFPGDEWRLLVPGRAPVDAPRGPNLTVVRTRVPGRAVFGAAALAGEPTLDRLLGRDLDVAWSPAPAPVAVGRHTPFVLTVHDRSFEARPQDFSPYERAWHRLARPRALAARAARVLVDTAAVGEELAAAWGLDPARIDVVRPGAHPGTGPPFAVRATAGEHGGTGTVPRRAERADKGSVPPFAGRYFLFVGALEPRKAPDLLVRAHAAAGTGAALVFAGEGRLASRLRGPGVHLLGRVGDRELGDLMEGALALVLPSYLEGFGFPPLEAALHGTPSVVSDLPVLRETLEDAALFVPPGDERALAAALTRIAADAALRDTLAARAAPLAARCTWPAAARAARQALARACGGE